MASKKYSSAWNYFDVIDDGKYARCHYCKKSVVSNGSTGNLFRHMKLKHPTLLVERTGGKPTPASNGISSIDPTEAQKSAEFVPCTILEVVHANTIDLSVAENSSQQPRAFYLISHDERRQQEFNKQLLKVVIKNLIPFDIVEGQEFIKFVNMLNPNYALPNRKTLANNILDNVYQVSVDELKCVLKDIAVVALTTDSWTSINNEHLIAFSVHYLNKDLELKSNFLQCFSFPQKLNCADVTLIIEELSSKWNLSNKIMAVTTDGSEEIVKAVHNCNLNHILCFTHILNKIVQAGLLEINSFVLKIRNVVGYFKENSTLLNKFCVMQNEMGLSDSVLIKDMPFRWETTFNMFISCLKNRLPLLSTIEKLKLNFLNLTSVDFNYLESVIKVLVIFNSIKIAICSEKYLSLSKIFHFTNFMSSQLENILKNSEFPQSIIEMVVTIKAELKQFEELEINELVCQGVLLDPRFKKRGFPNNFFKEACIALQQSVIFVREEIMKEKMEVSYPSEPFEQNKIESEYLIDMWSEFESKESPPLHNHKAAASVEIDAFLNDVCLPIENDPLTYWANVSNQNKFPALFELVKRVLCIPATSVPHQQIYSRAGHAFFKKRQYLPSTIADKILFLHHNM